MLIKSQYSINKGQSKGQLLIGIALVVLVLLLLITFIKGTVNQDQFSCDMESLVNDENGINFNSSGQYFSNGQTQSDTKSFKGKYSALCSNSQKYGPTFVLYEVNGGDIIEATIWQQSDEGYGSLVVQGLSSDYYNFTRKAKQVNNNWEQLSIIDTIPLGVKNASLKIYPMIASSEGRVYFDDLEIKHTKNKVNNNITSNQFDVPILKLQVEEKDIEKLRIKRTEALHLGNLITGSKDLVKGKLFAEDQELNIQLRLKGDLLDHLQGKKWSFRIVPEKNESWNNMRTFSVHNTASRAHIMEWVFHQMLVDEGILTTRYDFIHLFLNDEDLGIYAYEEHFESPLLLHQNREVGPILRISEDGLWQYAASGLTDDIPWFESAHIESFEQKKILSNDNLRQQFIEGQQKLFDYVNGNKNVAELFDIDKMAKFMAILDVCMAWHAFGSTNQRFYYNAAIGKLEPIGYDGYSSDGIQWFTPPLIYGAHTNKRVSKKVQFRNQATQFNYFLFNDLEFTKYYIKYLEAFSSTAYIEAFLEKHLSSIKSREAIIKLEYKDYQFDKDKFFKNAEKIRTILYPADNVTIKAYKNNAEEITIENYHRLPIAIVGFGNSEIEYPLKEPLVAESYNAEIPVQRYTINVTRKYKNVFCKTLGTEKVIRLPIFNWPAPISKIPYPKANIHDLKDRSEIIIKDQKIFFKTGINKISTDLLIPEGFEVNINAQTQIELSNGASIVSYSPIFAKGQANNPIIISSKNGGQGLAILNTAKESTFKHIVFKGLNARNKDGQIMQGAVSFYEADFKCRDCQFENIKSKDALSIMNSKYQLDDILILNASGDGIDANQSHGIINKLKLIKAGNDGIEITGGYCEINESSIEKAFGAGINANRSAVVHIKSDLKIESSEEGIKATDLSQVEILNLILNTVKTGIIAYEKLAHYGPPKLDIKNIETENVDQLHTIDQGAILLLKGEKIANK